MKDICLSEAIGHALKVARVRARKKQKDVAKKCNISANYLCLVEAGKRHPSLFVLSSICDALGIKTWEIIKEIEEESK